jgi:hypothetical protein
LPNRRRSAGMPMMGLRAAINVYYLKRLAGLARRAGAYLTTERPFPLVGRHSVILMLATFSGILASRSRQFAADRVDAWTAARRGGLTRS